MHHISILVLSLPLHHVCLTIFASYYTISGQLPELHARICQTYVEALEGDKALPTLYGAIVGLSALGNNVVRKLLLPHLQAILSRLQESGENSGRNNGSSNSKSDSKGDSHSNGHSSGTSAVSSEEGRGDKGKRKRSDSIDNNNNSNTTNPTASSSTTNGSAKKFNKHSAAKILQEQVTRGMCREALIRALGKL